MDESHQSKHSLILNVLSNRVRIKILEILSNNDGVSFSELKRTLNISTGSIYYHLSALSEFIKQDDKKRYKLNERGKVLYNFLKNNREKIFLEEERVSEKRAFINVSFILIYLNQNYKYFLFIIPLIILTSSYSFFVSNLEMRLLFIVEISSTSFYTSIINFLINWSMIYIITNIFSSLISGRRGNNIELMLGVSIALVPLLTFPFFWNFLQFLSFNENVIRAVFLLLQALSLFLLIKSIQIFKGISLEQSIISSIIVFLFSISYFLIMAF